MRKIRKWLCAVIAALIIAGLTPAAFAEDNAGADAALAEEYGGKSWDQVLEELMEQYNTKADGISVGYYNTVTGEEHYYLADVYRVSGSMYKIPLNMYFTEKISSGQMDWTDTISGVQYQKLLEWTIINSDNDMARLLWKRIGTYRQYREAICPYMGVDAETVDAKYYENNFFTAEQMLHCLKELYDNQEKYPRIIDTMLQAEQDNYFLFHKQDVDVAHKYGYYVENPILYLNDCGVCYTDEPILLVLFTEGISQPYVFMTEFCRTMIEYTQYNTVVRLERERQEAMERAEQAAVEMLTSRVSADKGVKLSAGQIAASILCIAVSVPLFISVGKLAKRKKIKAPLGYAAVALALIALLICFNAQSLGTAVSKPEGDPQQVAVEFFDAVERGDFEHANALLDNYSTLGLEKDLGEGVPQEVYAALRESYSYSLFGDCVSEKLTAVQPVIFKYLDLNSMQADLKDATNRHIARLVNELNKSELFNEDGSYRSEVTEQAYRSAVEELLDNAEKYTATVGISLELKYSDGQWHVVADNALISALSGGAYGRGDESK